MQKCDLVFRTITGKVFELKNVDKQAKISQIKSLLQSDNPGLDSQNMIFITSEGVIDDEKTALTITNGPVLIHQSSAISAKSPPILPKPLFTPNKNMNEQPKRGDRSQDILHDLDQRLSLYLNESYGMIGNYEQMEINQAHENIDNLDDIPQGRENLDFLIQSGFDRNKAAMALRQTNGNFDDAVSLIFSGKMPPTDDHSPRRSTNQQNPRPQHQQEENDHLAALVEMGFDQTTARNALSEANNNFDRALTSLISERPKNIRQTPPPRTPNITSLIASLSPSEQAAVRNLCNAGFQQDLAIQVYLACDKNEHTALSCLRDMS